MGIAKDKLKLNSINSLFGETENKGDIIEVPLAELHSFTNHPFKVNDDEQMDELVESIRENGVITPATVRKTADGYELISGHRRKHACEIAGLDKMPVIVKDLTDEEATILMVDSNLQREMILPSEKAKAYKMKLEATKKQNKVGKPKEGKEQQGKNSIDIVAEEVGESKSNVQRFIRLTNLNEDLLNLVDDKKLPMNVAVELSYLKEDEQTDLVDYYEDCQKLPSIDQAKQLKEKSEAEDFENTSLVSVMNKATPKQPSISTVKIGKELKSIIPPSMSKEALQELVNTLLTDYIRKNFQDFEENTDN